MHSESFDVVSPPPNPQAVAERDGKTFDMARDGARLNAQHARVWEAMKDGRWRSLATIAAASQAPEASVSARLRDFRKPRFGSHDVERRHVADGLWEYRLLINRPDLFAEVGPRAPRCEFSQGQEVGPA